MKTHRSRRSSKQSFSYDEFKKAFLPSALEKPSAMEAGPAELGVKMAKKALAELGGALKASFAKR
jgi:hypothetical protein